MHVHPLTVYGRMQTEVQIITCDVDVSQWINVSPATAGGTPAEDRRDKRQGTGRFLMRVVLEAFAVYVYMAHVGSVGHVAGSTSPKTEQLLINIYISLLSCCRCISRLQATSNQSASRVRFEFVLAKLMPYIILPLFEFFKIVL